MTYPPKTDPHVKLEWWIMGGREMSRKLYTPEQIIGKLREAEVAYSCSDPKLITEPQNSHIHIQPSWPEGFQPFSQVSWRSSITDI